MKDIKLLLKNKWSQYMRVWRIMKKPTMEEFKMVAKVSAVGVLILGFMGFLINMIINLIF